MRTKKISKTYKQEAIGSVFIGVCSKVARTFPWQSQHFGMCHSDGREKINAIQVVTMTTTLYIRHLSYSIVHTFPPLYVIVILCWTTETPVECHLYNLQSCFHSVLETWVFLWQTVCNPSVKETLMFQGQNGSNFSVLTEEMTSLLKRRKNYTELAAARLLRHGVISHY
jgi:hypothetical protein